MGYLTSNVPATEKKLQQYLGPIIEERLRQDAELGRDWPGKPVSLLYFLYPVLSALTFSLTE
jgi:hypothetical protein